MKLERITILPLLATAAAVPLDSGSTAVESITPQLPTAQLHHLEKRQFWDSVGGLLQSYLPGLLRWTADNVTWMLKWQEQPLKKVKLRPVINQKAQRAIFKYGPWVLTGSSVKQQMAPFQMDPKSTMILRTLRGMPSNAAILSAKPSLVYEDGSPAGFSEGVYIHHFLVADMHKPSAPFALCPHMHKENSLGIWAAGYVLEAVGAGLIQVGNDAVGGANVFSPLKGNVRSAFLTNNDDLFVLQAEIVNYHPENRTVYLEMELEYLEQKPNDYLDASTMVLSVNGCEHPAYFVPTTQKQFNYTSENFEITQDGYIVNARGHLHDGGTGIELWVNNTLACRSLPDYGRPENSELDLPETILSMSWCENVVRIRKGDFLRVITYYDVDKHPLRKSAGSMHGSHGGGGGEQIGVKEGIEEMGIMTTNFAWDMPIDMKGTGGSSLAGWATPDKAAIPNTSNQPDKTKTEATKETSWLSSLFSSSGQSMKVESPKSITSPSPSPSSDSWWSNLFGGITALPTPTPNTKSPATPASPAVSPTASSVGVLGWLFGGPLAPTPTPAKLKEDVRS